MYGELAIFSGSANPDLAREICDYLNVPLQGVTIIDYPNENIFIKLQKSVRGQDVFIIQPMTSPVTINCRNSCMRPLSLLAGGRTLCG